MTLASSPRETPNTPAPPAPRTNPEPKTKHIPNGRILTALLAGSQPLKWPENPAQPAYKQLITHKVRDHQSHRDGWRDADTGIGGGQITFQQPGQARPIKEMVDQRQRPEPFVDQIEPVCPGRWLTAWLIHLDSLVVPTQHLTVLPTVWYGWGDTPEREADERNRT